MPTNIRPVIIENIVQFSGLGLPRGRCPDCHKMPFKSLMLCSWDQRFYPGTTWAFIEDDYTKKDRAFSVSWGERVFSQHPRSKYSRMLADRPENWTHQLWSHVIFDKQRVLMHRHQGWNVRHGLCHIYMRYLYIYELFIAFVCYLPKFTFWQVCSFVGLSVCLSVSLSVLSSITHERFDISSPNLVHIWNGWAVSVCDIDK